MSPYSPNVLDHRAHRANYAALLVVILLLLAVCGAQWRALNPGLHGGTEAAQECGITGPSGD